MASSAPSPAASAAASSQASTSVGSGSAASCLALTFTDADVRQQAVVLVAEVGGAGGEVPDGAGRHGVTGLWAGHTMTTEVDRGNAEGGSGERAPVVGPRTAGRAHPDHRDAGQDGGVGED